MSQQAQFAHLMEALGADSVENRVQALHDLRQLGTVCLPALLTNVVRHELSVAARIWTMMAIGQLGPSVAMDAHAALVACLSCEHPTIRRARSAHWASLKT